MKGRLLVSLKILLSAVVLTMITYYLYSSSYILNVIEAVKPKLVKETSNDNNQSNAPNTPPRTTASLQAVVNKVRSSSARIVTRNCTMWQFPDQLQSFDQPRIILDPNRFLYPGLIWGPNNQINGLMHTIYLSITLNRTLVLPKFRAQFTNPGLLSPYQAIDVERLCRFVTCLSLEEFRRKCNSSFDLAFQIRTLQPHHLKQLEEDANMSLLHPKRIFQNISFPSKLHINQRNQVSEMHTLPNQNSTLKFGEILPSDKKVLRTAFDTSAQCVTALSMYKWIQIGTPTGLAMSVNEVDQNASVPELPDKVLYSIIMNNVRHPPCIVGAALQYVQEVLDGRKYVGLHWRYDEQDFLSVCRNKARWAKTICSKLENIKPKFVAEAIYNELQKSNQTSLPLPVYIAAPPDEKDFVHSVYEELENLTFTRPSMSVETFLTNKYGDCWQNHGWTNIPDIISLSEMEVMKNSFWFFYSAGSTWSQNIRPFRSYKTESGKFQKKFEADILQQVHMIKSRPSSSTAVPSS